MNQSVQESGALVSVQRRQQAMRSATPSWRQIIGVVGLLFGGGQVHGLGYYNRNIFSKIENMKHFTNHRSMQRSACSILCILALQVLCLSLVGCGRSGEPTVAVVSPGASQSPGASISITPAASDTPAPSPTLSRSKVILLALPGSDAGDVLALQQVLGELAAKEGLQFETQSDLPDMDLGAEVRILVVIPPDPGALNLAAANSQIQILAIGIPGLEAARNLSVIGSQGERPDQQGFLAGYMAALITPDWRVGVVSRSDTVEGKAARNGFVNGVIFYCGLCRPAYPPFLQYPVTVDLPGDAGQVEQQAAVDVLRNSAVKTVYIFPGAGDMTLLESLALAGVNLIGGAVAPTQLQQNWVASITVDHMAALRQIWPRLMAGENGISVDVPLAINDRNEALFSIGRQRLADELLQNLMADLIDTGVNLETGEPR
jgi:hypothetical protein